MLHIGERNAKGEPGFKWGQKTGVGIKMGHQFYGSFFLNGSEYFLYDCVYIFRKGDCETTIGKLVKMFETTTQERKVKVVLFFRPNEIRQFLRDVEPRWNEIFLASGEGVGVSKYYFLEEIIRKCNVICTLKDRRNPQPSEAELSLADYIFYRRFDVKKCMTLEDFPNEIDRVKVKFFFNREQDTEQNKKNLGVCAENSSLLSKSGQKNMADSSLKGVKSIEEINNRNKGQWAGSDNDEGNPKLRDRVISNMLPHKKMKTILDGQSPVGQNSGPVKRVHNVKASETCKRAAPQIIQEKASNTKTQLLETARKPIIDRANWFKQPTWEQRLQQAQEVGTLVLLENLDPTFSSSEVKDLVQRALKQRVDAKMLQFSAIWKAFVLFKSKVAAEMVISELTQRCLMLSDGRPVIGSTGTLANPSKRVNFVGHLTIQKLLRQKQTEAMWRLLQEQSDLWWKKLHEKQMEEVLSLKRQLKLKHVASGSLI